MKIDVFGCFFQLNGDFSGLASALGGLGLLIVGVVLVSAAVLISLRKEQTRAQLRIIGSSREPMLALNKKNFFLLCGVPNIQK